MLKPNRLLKGTIIGIVISFALAACSAPSQPEPPLSQDEPTVDEQEATAHEPVKIPSAEELCTSLTPEEINAAFAWTDFTVDPGQSATSTNRGHSLCELSPWEIDWSADVFGLTVNAYPLDYNFAHQEGSSYTRDALPGRWANGDRTLREISVNGHPAWIPVSYTHLDVYKRQVQRMPLSRFQATWPE